MTRRSYFDQFDETSRFKPEMIKANMPHMNKTPRKDRIAENTIFDSNFSSTKRSQLQDQSSMMSGVQSLNPTTGNQAPTTPVNLTNRNRDHQRGGSGLDSALPTFKQDDNSFNAIQQALQRA